MSTSFALHDSTKHKYSNKPDLEAHAQVTRQSATEGMVLLENHHNALPLNADVKTAALFGITSYDFIAGGTGSDNVNRAYTVSLLDGLKNVGITPDTNLQQLYADYKAKLEQGHLQGMSGLIVLFSY